MNGNASRVHKGNAPSIAHLVLYEREVLHSVPLGSGLSILDTEIHSHNKWNHLVSNKTKISTRKVGV